MGAVIVAFVAALPLLGAINDVPDAPVVVVYPLTATGNVPKGVGENLATAIGSDLASLGGVVVRPYTPGTQRTDYLVAAQKEGADYYVTGFLTPLGSEMSLVEQVVSTRSGSIVYSTTAFARTYADAIGPVPTLRDAIVHHAGRGFAQLDAPPPPPPSAEPIGSNGRIDISKALKRRHKGKASPAPSPSASAVASSSPGAAPTAATPPPH